MSERVTTSGTFLAKATDWGVTETQESGLPQYFLDMNLIALWDAENEEWLDYVEQDENHSDFFCLYGKKGQELRVSKQIAKIFGWSGKSFAELAQLDISDIEFQVRIEENDPEYAEKRPFRAEWLDVADAIPGSGVPKLDDKGLAAMDKKYAIALKKGGTAVAAKSADAKSAPRKPQTRKPAREKEEEHKPLPPETPEAVTAEEKQKNMAEKARKNAERKAKEAKEAAAKKAPAKPRPRPGAKKGKTEAVEFPALDGDTAWAKICEAQAAADMSDKDAEAILYEISVQVTGDKDHNMDDFTDEQWGETAVRTIAKIQESG